MVVIESCCFLLFSLAALCGSSRSSFVIILRDIAIDVLVTQLCLHSPEPEDQNKSHGRPAT